MATPTPSTIPGIVLSEKDSARFASSIFPEPNTGCWLWGGPYNGHGYGAFSFGGKRYAAHRVTILTVVSQIPPGMHVDHLCMVKCCVNPDHLEVVTSGENTRRAIAAGHIGGGNREKTHCIHGHPFTPENTRLVARGRECRTCQRRHHRDWKRRCADRSMGGSHEVA